MPSEAPAVPAIAMNDGAEIPVVGFGTYKVDEADVGAALRTAFEAGYRSVDTAALYRNERGVGRAVAESGIARADLYVTTKLWNDQHGFDAALRAFDASMDRLRLDYVDLYLIHWPVPSQDAYVETWRALERIAADGRARSIGVSNFQPVHLRRLLDECDVVPALNQVELHPRLQQAELRAFHDQHGIVTEAWSPLARATAGVSEHPTITDVAGRLGVTPAQVVMRWQVQLGNVVIPKSVTPSRIRENIDVFGFELAADDMAAIERMDDGTRLGPDPDRM